LAAQLAITKKRNVSFDPTTTVHHIRQGVLSRCPELRNAPQKYRELKDLSESVRYDADFTYTPAHHQYSKELLIKIVSIVEPKIKK
jgi:hypothetical protein